MDDDTREALGFIHGALDSISKLIDPNFEVADVIAEIERLDERIRGLEELL